MFRLMFRRSLLVLLSILLSLGFFLTSRAGGPVQQSPLYPASVTVQKSANLRKGPDTTYAIVGGAKAGDLFNVIGCNADCSWYQLAPDCWIAAFLVKPQQAVSPLIGSVPVVSVVIAVGTPGPVVTPTPFVQTTRCPQIKEPVNTYAGPSTLYAVADTRPAGECISVVGRNQVGDWFQLSHGMWILASAVLYAEPITTMPITEPTPIAILVPVVESQPLTPTDTLTPTAIVEVQATVVAPVAGEGCDPNYAGACVPVFPPDVNCGSLPKNFSRIGNDPHGLDTDYDGIACEDP